MYALGVGAKHDELSLVYGKKILITLQSDSLARHVAELGRAFLTSLRSTI
jgi:hypothetical protein